LVSHAVSELHSKYFQCIFTLTLRFYPLNASGISHSRNCSSQKTAISWHMAQNLKFSLRGRKQERRKRKNSQAIISLLSLQRNVTLQNATLEHHFRCLLWLQRSYSVPSSKAQKRYSPQYPYYKEILIPSASAIYELLSAKRSHKTTNSSSSVTRLCMQCVRMHHIRVPPY